MTKPTRTALHIIAFGTAALPDIIWIVSMATNSDGLQWSYIAIGAFGAGVLTFLLGSGIANKTISPRGTVLGLGALMLLAAISLFVGFAVFHDFTWPILQVVRLGVALALALFYSLGLFSKYKTWNVIALTFLVLFSAGFSVFWSGMWGGMF